MNRKIKTLKVKNLEIYPVTSLDAIKDIERDSDGNLKISSNVEYISDDEYNNLQTISDKKLYITDTAVYKGNLLVWSKNLSTLSGGYSEPSSTQLTSLEEDVEQLEERIDTAESNIKLVLSSDENILSNVESLEADVNSIKTKYSELETKLDDYITTNLFDTTISSINTTINNINLVDALILTDINTIEGTGQGSITYSVLQETDRAEGAEDLLQESIDNISGLISAINGDSSTNGSILNALLQAKSYTDALIVNVNSGNGVSLDGYATEEEVLSVKDSIPSKVSELENDSNYVKSTELGEYVSAVSQGLNTLEADESTEGSVDYKIAQAKNDLVDNASDDYNTLGKLEIVIKSVAQTGSTDNTELITKVENLETNINNYIAESLEDKYAYGIEWDESEGSIFNGTVKPKRIGNIELHKTLPILNSFKGCIAQGKTIIEWLNPDDWRMPLDEKLEGAYTAEFTLVAPPNLENNILFVPCKLVSSIDDATFGELQGVQVKFNDNWYKAIVSTNYKQYTSNTYSDANCLLVFDDNSIYSDLSTFYTSDGDKTINGVLGPRLDGYNGEVKVQTIPFYIKSWLELTLNRVMVSTVHIDDSWQYQPPMLLGAYVGSVVGSGDFTQGYCKVSQTSFVSIMNFASRTELNRNNYDKYYNGSSNTEVDIFRTAINKPFGGYYPLQYNTTAGRVGSNMIDYRTYKNIFVWLYIIEYCSFNYMDDFISELTSEGYKQGGLGKGMTGIDGDDWEAYNSRIAICPIGYTNTIGNGTGIKEINITANGNNYTLYGTRWHGLENIFGDTAWCMDGMTINEYTSYKSGYLIYYERSLGDLHDSTNASHSSFYGAYGDIQGVIPTNTSLFVKSLDMQGTAELIPKTYIDTTNFTEDLLSELYKYSFKFITNKSSSTKNLLFPHVGITCAGTFNPLSLDFLYYYSSNNAGQMSRITSRTVTYMNYNYDIINITT